MNKDVYSLILGPNLNQFDSNKVGKWMYFFDDKEFILEICRNAVASNIVNESKHTDDETGVACFYLNCDYINTHWKVTNHFLENNFIQKTKTGCLYNISFKLDKQTLAGE